MENIGFCGFFAHNTNMNDGQTVKTRVLKKEVSEVIGEENVQSLDIYRWQRRPLELLVKSFKLSRKSDHLIFITGRRGAKILIPLFVFLKIINRNKLHYITIGGSWPEYISGNFILNKLVKYCDGVYGETQSMIEKMKKNGHTNCYVLPNFKRHKVIGKDNLIMKNTKPFALCTFSRVVKEKGIETAIKAVCAINNEHTDIMYTLDIYGPIGDNYKDEFDKIIKNTPDYIRYKGNVHPDKSVEIIKNYTALIFPTFHKGEGFPGTILDSLASGVPILASDWRYNSEIVENGTTGVIFKGFHELVDTLKHNIENPNFLLDMKEHCIDSAMNFQPETLINKFLREHIKFNDNAK